MKRLFSLFTALVLAVALCAPAMADDQDNSNPTPASSEDAYVSAYTVTDAAGGEVNKIEVGDRINIVLKVVDHASARYNVKAEEISARINSSAFTFTGIGEVGQLFASNDDPDQQRLQRVRSGNPTGTDAADNAQYNYYSYVLLFRDVIYNGGGNTLPINLSYMDTSKPLQQFSVTIGQCVDKDQTTSPNLLVRSSSYGDSVTAGTAFTLSLGVYATDGSEALNDVIIALTLPENISLKSGSLSSYVGSISPKQTREVSFDIMPSAGFAGTVADITVNMSGTGAVTGKAVTATTTISVPVSQPNRFEVGQLELSSDTIYVGDTGSVTLTYVNKGKNAVSNLEARLTGSNLGAGGYQYLGNLNAGTEGSVDFDIVPDAAGTVSGVITLSYEDASGNPQTISKDFSISAEEMNMDDSYYDPSMDDVQPEQTGMPVWAWVLIGVCGAVVIIVIVVVVVRKRKKAKALAALEEDSDEDI
ncbi:COG1361 S-layer family protein [uncultured Gemmiger sp.]|uniref:COG1361 S-layer family protein n=1 Tax=uncultured Gemmiger sp. TaxID=1623490 RepID=UPI0025CD5C23|nr:GGIII-like transmembrane region-containing protein [uncultured Gemmiger sp.]